MAFLRHMEPKPATRAQPGPPAATATDPHAHRRGSPPAELRKPPACRPRAGRCRATIAAVAIAALTAGVAGRGKGETMLPIQLGVGLATSVGAIVLGAWMMGI